MTEKRFSMDKSGDLYDKNKMIMLDFGYSYDGVGCKRIIELLNSLSDENEQLKQKVNFYKYFQEDARELEKENEELQHECNYLQNRLDDFINVQKENEQLKKDLKRCREWINSDKYDYETTLAFIKSKGYSLKDVLEYKGDVE